MVKTRAKKAEELQQDQTYLRTVASGEELRQLSDIFQPRQRIYKRIKKA